MNDSGTRAAASRRNGAKSRRPKAAAGRAQVARNASSYGLGGRPTALLDDESAAALDALEAALHAELAPEGVLQTHMVRRMVSAAWRARRADRIEADLLDLADADPADHDAQAAPGGGPGGADRLRALDTLIRYRASALAELFRSLDMLEQLQAGMRDRSAKPSEPEKAFRVKRLAFAGGRAH